jgi:hypothetical protein
VSEEPPRWVRAGLLGVVLLPILVAVVRAVTGDWFPIGDAALLAVRANDVLTEHHPLLGSWTSASLSVGQDVNNPGAIYQDLVALVSRPLGFPSPIAIGVGLLNGLSVVGLSVVARRVGGWALERWALLAAALLVWILGSELLIDLWQPHALLLPSLLLFALAAGLARGRWGLLPATAAVASVLVQTHISYVYVLLVLGVAVVVAALVTRGVVRPSWRAVAVTVAVVAVTWAQPVWEQVMSPGPGEGNLSRLASSAGGGDLQLGLVDGTRFAGRILGQWPVGLRSGFATLVPPTQVEDGRVVFPDVLGVGPAAAIVVVLVAVLAVLTVLLHQRRGRSALAALAAVAAVLTAAAPICLAGVTIGPVGFAPHHVRWLWPLGVLVWTVLLAGVVELLAARAATVVAAALTVAAAVAAVPFLAQPQGPVADSWAVPALARVRASLPAAGLDEVDPVRYDTSNLRIYEPYSSAVMLRLQELGVEFRVSDPALVRQLGEERRSDGGEHVRLFQLEGIDALADDVDACLLVRASALDPSAERRAAELVDAAAADRGVARRQVLEGPAPSPAVRRWVETAFALYADPGDGRCP